MKFLSRAADNAKLMPINFQYIDSGDEDVIYIAYKDINTGEKYVEAIKSPKIDIYIVKPEYRGIEHIAPKNRMRDFIEAKYLEKHSVRYQYRKYEEAKILGIHKENIMKCTYVLGLDVKIEHFYFMEFKREYGNDLQKPLKIAFADIETEIKYAPYTGLAPYGKVPISLITVIDATDMVSYTLALYNENYAGIDELWTKEGLETFKKELNESFDSTYGHIEYNFSLYYDEMHMLIDFWSIVKMINPDFLEYWNMPFDMGNIIERLRELGVDPGEAAMDIDYYDKPFVFFKEDTNITPHKRKHLCELPIATVIACQMRNYAVIRSSGPKIPDFKLNTIADKELEDKKVEYAEDYGSIADFPYKNYKKFVKYNIKDVLLQVGIDATTHDTNDIYARMYDFCVLQSEVSTTTTIVANHYRMELNTPEMGYKIMCNNRNKIEGFVAESTLLYDNDYDESENDDVDGALEDIHEEEVLVDENGKKIKYDGAIVLNPTRMNSSGFDGFKYIHNNAIDEDIGAEYPSSTQISNLSNETFIGKVVLDGKFEMPMYNYTFANSEEAGLYKYNPAAIALETFAGGDVLLGAELFLGLPSPSEVLHQLDLSKILKKRSD